MHPRMHRSQRTPQDSGDLRIGILSNEEQQAVTIGHRQRSKALKKITVPRLHPQPLRRIVRTVCQLSAERLRLQAVCEKGFQGQMLSAFAAALQIDAKVYGDS